MNKSVLQKKMNIKTGRYGNALPPPTHTCTNTTPHRVLAQTPWTLQDQQDTSDTRIESPHRILQIRIPQWTWFNYILLLLTEGPVLFYSADLIFTNIKKSKLGEDYLWHCLKWPLINSCRQLLGSFMSEGVFPHSSRGIRDKNLLFISHILKTGQDKMATP